MSNTLKTQAEASKYVLERLLERDDLATLLITLKTHHVDTYEHSYRTALTSIQLGYANRRMEPEIVLLGYAGLLHDLGKNCMPIEIIDSPNALDEHQRKTMNAHPRLGFIQLKDFHKDVQRIVVAHHEFKPNPYPRTGNDRREHSFLPRETKERRNHDARITTLAQIVSAADMHDALRSRRPYKEPLSQEEITKILRTQYTGDQKYVDQLIA